MIIDDCYLLLLLDTCWETPDVLRPNTDRDPTMMVMLVLSKIMLILPHESGQGRSALQPCPDGRLVWSFVHRVAAQAGTLARPGAQRIAALAGRPVRPGVQRATALPGRLVRPGAQGATAGLKMVKGMIVRRPDPFFRHVSRDVFPRYVLVFNPLLEKWVAAWAPPQDGFPILPVARKQKGGKREIPEKSRFVFHMFSDDRMNIFYVWMGLRDEC